MAYGNTARKGKSGYQGKGGAKGGPNGGIRSVASIVLKVPTGEVDEEGRAIYEEDFLKFARLFQNTDKSGNVKNYVSCTLREEDVAGLAEAGITGIPPKTRVLVFNNQDD